MISYLVTAPAPVEGRQAPASTALRGSSARAGCQARIERPALDVYVRAARHFATVVLERWNLASDDQDTAVLIISELATNAA